MGCTRTKRIRVLSVGVTCSVYAWTQYDVSSMYRLQICSVDILNGGSLSIEWIWIFHSGCSFTACHCKIKLYSQLQIGPALIGELL